MVELLYQAGVIFDEEFARAKAEIDKLWTEKINELKAAFALDISAERKRADDAAAERDVWRLVGVGGLVGGLTGIAFGALHK